MSNRQGYSKYHESIAKEFEAKRNRVRYFIDNNHWGEDGRYKEILLANYLKSVLPSNVSVGTGFVKSKENLSKQIDIIIYRNDLPTLFSEGDFVIVVPESVYGIIEVKSKLSNDNFKEAVENSSFNGNVIEKDTIFNGIFSYDNSFNFRCVPRENSQVRSVLKECPGMVNHISFGSQYFCRYWRNGNPVEENRRSVYSFYKLMNMSFGYFISNLIESIHSQSNTENYLTKNLLEYLYPIEGGKETQRLKEWDVKVDVPIS